MSGFISEQLERFIRDELETVPHLEALIVLWNSRPRAWSAEEIAEEIYVSNEAAQVILEDLRSKNMAVRDDQSWSFNLNYPRSSLIEELEKAYRRHLVKIATMIHSKASPSARAFARAFKLWR